MPLSVLLYQAIGKLLLTPIVKLYFRLTRNVTDHAPIIAEIIIAIITVTFLVLQLINVVGKDRLKSDIWIMNFVESITPQMTFVNIIIVIIQTCVINSLMKTSVTENSSKHNKLTGMAMPEMVSLMVTLSYHNKIIYF